MTAEQDFRRLRRRVAEPHPDLAARIADTLGASTAPRTPAMRRARGVAVGSAVILSLGAAAAVVVLRHPDPPVTTPATTSADALRNAAQVLLAAGRPGSLPPGVLGDAAAEVDLATVRDIATVPIGRRGTEANVRAFALGGGEACLVVDVDGAGGSPRCIAADDSSVLFRVRFAVEGTVGFAGAVRSDVVALRLEAPGGTLAIPVHDGAFTTVAPGDATLVASLRDGRVVRFAVPEPSRTAHPAAQSGAGREEQSAIIEGAGSPVPALPQQLRELVPTPPVASVRRLATTAGSPPATIYAWAANGAVGYADVYPGGGGGPTSGQAGPPVYAITIYEQQIIVLTSSRVRRVWATFANGDRMSVPIVRNVAVVRVPLAHRTFSDPGPTVLAELDDGRMVDVTHPMVGLGGGSAPP